MAFTINQQRLAQEPVAGHWPSAAVGGVLACGDPISRTKDASVCGPEER